ncbi:unnamed protein product [Bursaphelenchus okinawaensis]|uniref:Uncharacterized protein n=1 Tax=Bursaphelenchus okinawaensis TaxID=465554 RepID=A0A811KJD9_9BILA|nr:unnamed protein product [Bursaphelenchus okinawaensis]CAG9103732.1 unnamed protein product [Bursaphelenchus okinawaensis]
MRSIREHYSLYKSRKLLHGKSKKRTKQSAQNPSTFEVKQTAGGTVRECAYYGMIICRSFQLLKQFKKNDTQFKSDDPKVDSLMTEAIFEFHSHLKQIHQLYALTEVYVAQRREQLKEESVKSSTFPINLAPLQRIQEIQRKPRKKFTINELLDNQNNTM